MHHGRAYCVADRDGELVSEQWPYCSTMHDFAITERHAIFPVFPTTADLDRMKAGGDHWARQQDLESWVGIMPRDGKVEHMRWFKGPKGVFAFHIVNAFTDGDLVHLDLCLSDTNPFPFMREAGGIQWDKPLGGGLFRWTFDLSKPGEDFVQRPIGPPGDMPRLADADQGRPYRQAWCLSMNPQGGPPLIGGAVGVSMTALLSIEPGNGRIAMMGLDLGMAINEPVHIPAADPDGAGWLLSVVAVDEGPLQGVRPLGGLSLDEVQEALQRIATRLGHLAVLDIAGGDVAIDPRQSAAAAV